MKALMFSIDGRTAFFKKPDVNTYVYFTYGNLHKVALLGILGAVLGLEGYNQQKDKKFPEFYEKLKDVKVSIVPMNSKGYFNKKVQTFNNSVGYASEEQGGNLVVKEQWIEEPKWRIFVALDGSSITSELQNRFEENSFVYIPYLGKNDHTARIKDIEVIEMEKSNDVSHIDSIFPKKYFECDSLDDDSDDEIIWKYEERLPIKLEETANQYITESCVHTNSKLIIKENHDLYAWNNMTLFFM